MQEQIPGPIWGEYADAEALATKATYLWGVAAEAEAEGEPEAARLLEADAAAAEHEYARLTAEVAQR